MQIAIRLVLLFASLMASVAVSVASADPPPSQHDFSADIVSHDASGAVIGTSGRLYTANGKVRIESSAAPAGFFLTDGATAPALFVRPRQRLFMDARQSTPLTRIFLPVEVSDPCGQWQAAATMAGVASAAADWHCQHTKSQKGIVEYTITSPNHEVTQGWVAKALGFPVKWQASDGTTFTLEHIRVEAQPPALFTIPADYRKSDPQALIDRIKHSDVWAAPPP